VNKIVWKDYKICLKIITPVIINNGAQFEPGELHSQNGKVYYLNLMKIFEDMDKGKVKEYIDSLASSWNTRNNSYFDNNDYSPAQKIISNFLTLKGKDINDYIFSEINILPSCKELFLKKPNQEINQVYFNKIKGEPYIPGSSIKGAIRTAILEKMRQQLEEEGIQLSPEKQSYKYKKTPDFETEIYSKGKFNHHSVKDDPFKFLKISDFHLKSSKLNLDKVDINSSDIPFFSTMTDAECFSENEVVAKGTISISSDIVNSPLREFSNLDSIFKACNEFFVNNFNKKKNRPQVWIDFEKRKIIISKLRSVLEDSSSNTKFLIRIGHFSGIENITYNVLQNPEINWKIKNKKVNFECSNARSLVEGFPLGYCALYKEED